MKGIRINKLDRFEKTDIYLLNLTVTEEVNKLRKDQKEIQTNIELLINTSRTEIETIKKSRDERDEKTSKDQQLQFTALSTRNIFKSFYRIIRNIKSNLYLKIGMA